MEHRQPRISTPPGAAAERSAPPRESSREKEFVLGDRDFRFLSELAHRRTGIVLAEHKRDMVYGRLVRRLRALKLTSFAEYCAVLEADTDGQEIGQLINAITTNLTGFFREEHHFEHLYQQLAPLADGPKRRLRLWSAACSSGMEPYSMAMVLRRAIPAVQQWDAKILATDIDTTMLDVARQGIYTQGDVEKLPAAYRPWVLNDGRQHVHMAAELKQLIRFKQLNLLDRWPMQGPFDAIFCRNVVIYFDKPTKIKLFDRLADMLTPQGWLYIGHSENLHGISTRFELVGRTLYRRIV